jgi:hypothetical protein
VQTEMSDLREKYLSIHSGSTLQWNPPRTLNQINPLRWAQTSDAYYKARQSRRFRGNVRQRPDTLILRVL